MIKKLFETYPFQTCISICAVLSALPLIWRQIPNISFILYPIILIGVSWGVGAVVDRLVRQRFTNTSPYPDLILLLVASLGLGFFAIWIATMPLEMGGNLWRGNVLLSNLAFAIMSLAAGLWAAYSIRLLQKSRTLETIGLIGGVALMLVVLMWSGLVYKLADFSIAKHFGSPYVRAPYIVYGLFEITYWRIVVPFGFAGALTLAYFGKKS